MNNILKTILIVLGALVVAGGLFFGGMFFAGFRTIAPWNMMGWGANSAYGPGMMGGARGERDGYGPGMMGRGYGNRANVTPLTVDETKQAAETYLKTIGIDGLAVGEVMIFDNNAYVVVKETSTGIGAFELLVDPISKTAYPEMGPNMMWNLKYGAVNQNGMTLAPGASAGVGGRGGHGMMGNWSNQNATPAANVSADMPVSQEQAIQAAQAYLDKYILGAQAANDPVKFFGYYTLDFEQNGKVVGMLSVNGYNGQVFLHTWHGTFIEESAIH